MFSRAGNISDHGGTASI